MTSEWKDHVAYCAREIVEMRKSFEQRPKKFYHFINNEVSDIDADLKKYWRATQGGE